MEEMDSKIYKHPKLGHICNFKSSFVVFSYDKI